MSRLRFGSIIDGELIMSDGGMLIADAWDATFNRFSGAAFDSMVIMPNHLHAIVQIGTDPNVSLLNLSSAIGAFKSISTVEYMKHVRRDRVPPFDGSLWKRSFHDRILRGERVIDSARLYIEGNPARWIAKYSHTQSS
jgi:REP element-mobilizing transposase RayT